MATLDFSQPISALLKAGTVVAHKELESSPGAGRLANGELQREEYTRLLIMLWLVYSTLEHHLAQHVDDPVLTSACNPQIHRASALSSDIARITQLPDWHASPFAQQILNDPPPSVKIYLDRLETVARTEPPLLLAHAYVRYLGDMSGGQFMKRRIKKSLDLEDEALQFFEFESTSSTALPDIKSLKEWFRDGMNNHVVDAHLKEQLVAEANRAFQLNGGLLSELRSPAERAEQAHKARVESVWESMIIVGLMVLGMILALGVKRQSTSSDPRLPPT